MKLSKTIVGIATSAKASQVFGVVDCPNKGTYFSSDVDDCVECPLNSSGCNTLVDTCLVTCRPYFDKDSGKKDNLVQIIVPIIVLILLVLGTAAGCFIRKRRNRNHGSDIVRNPSDVENVPKERKLDVDDHQHQNQSRDEQSHQNCESGKPVHHDTLPPGEQSEQEL